MRANSENYLDKQGTIAKSGVAQVCVVCHTFSRKMVLSSPNLSPNLSDISVMDIGIYGKVSIF